EEVQPQGAKCLGAWLFHEPPSSPGPGTRARESPCGESVTRLTEQRIWRPQLKPQAQRRCGPFKLLGILDVENIPCARDSILYGSLGSVVAGLGHFLLTSRIRRSCDVGVGGFILVTLGCWFHCRYNYAKLRIQERIAREGIKNKILYESTHLDPERKQTNGGSGGST
uniref:Cytochrome c oxidase assembly protein COX20, mitochondrial n=1 Tax=Camelus bactrianus TaxID=9837 RepID=A0A9W3H544_CAMBA